MRRDRNNEKVVAEVAVEADMVEAVAEVDTEAGAVEEAGVAMAAAEIETAIVSPGLRLATSALRILLQFGEDELRDFFERVEHALASNGHGFESGLVFHRKLLT